MKSPEGRAWWDKHGDMRNMTFDLTPGSKSMQSLNEYRKLDEQWQPRHGDDPDLDEGDIELLGKAWDERFPNGMNDEKK